MITVHIKNNKTGEIRKFVKDFEWGEGSLWQWTEGNFGCDCNRALFFARAKDEDETEAEEQPCGETAYSIPFIELEDGTQIKVDKEKI